MHTSLVSGLSALALSTLLASPGFAATPAVQCKALDHDACSAQPACSWVDGYVRKDGRQVQAYCRKAPRHKPANPVSSNTPLAGKAERG